MLLLCSLWTLVVYTWNKLSWQRLLEREAATNYNCSIPVTQQFSDKLKINPGSNKSATFLGQSLYLDNSQCQEKNKQPNCPKSVNLDLIWSWFSRQVGHVLIMTNWQENVFSIFYHNPTFRISVTSAMLLCSILQRFVVISSLTLTRPPIMSLSAKIMSTSQHLMMLPFLLRILSFNELHLNDRGGV